jgi:hypothetical protein
MLAEPLYVGYRSYRPDEERVEEVKQKLQENNIDINQLVERPVDHCPQEDCKQEENSKERKWRRKRNAP